MENKKIEKMLCYKNTKYLVGKSYIELVPMYDSRKSFYKKAKVYEIDGLKILVSYETIVAMVCDNIALVFGYYSPTTRRHTHDFLLQNGFASQNLEAKELKELDGNIKKEYIVLEK